MDEFDTPIEDFTVEFFVMAGDKQEDDTVRRRPNRGESALSEEMNRILLAEIHTHSRDPSYRRLLVNLREVKDKLGEAERVLGKPPVLSMRLAARHSINSSVPLSTTESPSDPKPAAGH